MSVFRRPNGPWPAPRLAISRQSWGGRANEEKVSGGNLINWTEAKSAKNSNGERRNFYKFFCVVSLSNLLSWVSDSGRAVGEWKTKVWRALFCHFFSSNFSDSAHRRSYMFTQCDQTSENMKTFIGRGKGGRNLEICSRNFGTFQFLILHWKSRPSCCRSGSLLERKLGKLFEFSETGKNFFLINSIKLRSWWSEKVQTDTESECAVSGEGNSSSQGQLGVVLDVRVRLWMEWRAVVGVFKSNLNNFSICHSQSGLKWLWKKHSIKLRLFLQR